MGFLQITAKNPLHKCLAKCLCIQWFLPKFTGQKSLYYQTALASVLCDSMVLANLQDKR